jgi:hypothetical protein
MSNLPAVRLPAPTKSPAQRDRATRDAIFEAAAGRGPHREGAFPILLDRPHEGTPSEPWDPVKYTLAMIHGAWPESSLRIVSAADWVSLRSILAQRVSELRDARDGRTSAGRRRLAMPARKSLPDAD